MLNILDEHTGADQGAHDARDEGAEQSLEFARVRHRGTMEMRFAMLEGVGAIEHQKYRADVDINSVRHGSAIPSST